MSYGVHGHGAVLSIGGTTIGDVISITGPNQSRDPIDISTMDSTSKWREFIPGMVDAGELTAEINYNGANSAEAETLQGLVSNTATQTVFITINDSTSTDSKWQCAGFVTGLGFAIPFDDKVTQSVSIKMTGAATYTNLS